jgi:hypothetical protein
LGHYQPAAEGNAGPGQGIATVPARFLIPAPNLHPEDPPVMLAIADIAA